MIFYLSIWFLGFLFTLFKGNWINFIGSDYFDFDLLTILISYLFMFYGNLAVGVFAFGQGFLIDLFSGGLHGLFACLYLCVFVSILLCLRFLDLRGVIGQVIIITLAVLLKKILFLVVLTVFAFEIYFEKTFIWISAASALITGLVAPFVFSLFDAILGVSRDAEGDIFEDNNG